MAYASEVGDPAFAGILLGITSAGSALGGLAYGSRGWHYPLARQFVLALAVMAAGLAVLALPWSPWWFVPWAKISRPEHATEALTWVTGRAACWRLRQAPPL